MVALPAAPATHVLTVRVRHLGGGGHVGDCGPRCGNLPILSRELCAEPRGVTETLPCDWEAED